MKYLDLAQIFSAHEANHPRYHLDGLITFSDFGPFENPSYTQLDRTYAVSSNNKAFLPNRLGFSIFGTAKIPMSDWNTICVSRMVGSPARAA